MSQAATYAFLAGLEQQARSAEVRSGTQEAYRWGRLDRRTQDFQPQARSGSAAIYESDELMSRRVRSQVLNNAQVKRVTEALVDLIVGPGMQTFSDPLDASVSADELRAGKFERELDHALEADEIHDEWFHDSRRFSSSRKLAGPDLQRMALKECIERGSVFRLECFKRNPAGEVELCYQLIERDQLDRSKDRQSAPGQNKIINGIEFNADDEEVAYHVYDAHPYDDFTGGGLSSQSTRIPASRMSHLALFTRPSDSLGVTWLHAIAQNQFDRDSFLSSELQTAARIARMMLVAKYKNMRAGAAALGLLLENDDPTDIYASQEIKLGNSPHAFVIGADDSIEVVESERANGNSVPFVEMLDRDTAGGVGLSSLTVSNNWANTSFSSAHAATLSEDLHMRPLQNWFAREFAIPIRRRKQSLDILQRRLKTVTVAQYLADRRKYERFEALGAGRDLLDPSNQTEASLGKLRGGLSTLKVECAKRGLHWIRVLRQASWENSVSKIFGVTLDFSKGQGSLATKTTRDSDPATETQRKAS